MTPAISVLMAVRDGEDYFDEAVASVLAQTRDDLELIVLDDGSTDRTAELLTRWTTKDPRVIALRQEPAGLAVALNRAARAARGTYLARQDADDVSLPERLACQAAYLAGAPGVAAVGVRADVIDAQGTVVGEVPAAHGAAAVRRGIASARLTVPHGSMMMRREAFEAVAGYREAFPVSQDLDLCLRLLDRADIDILDAPLYRWRRHPASVSSTRHTLQLLYTGVALALAAERGRAGADSYGALVAARGDLEGFARRYRLRGTLHARWGELLYRGLDDPRLARRHLVRALAGGHVRPRTLALLGWSVLGRPWPARSASPGRRRRALSR